MGTVIITDGEQRAALAAVRSLGRAGHEVYITSCQTASLAGESRFCQRSFTTPDPLSEPAAYAIAVQDIVDRTHADVLLPITEASILALLPERESFASVAFPFPSLDSFLRICDKATVMEAAGELGIGVPSQHRVDAPGSHLPEQLGYPLVVKPARSVVRVNGTRAKSSVLHVSDPVQLRSALAGLPDDAYPVLLQERIVGPGVGVFLLPWEGELLASFFHRRIREKPPSGGVSVYRESIPPDPELLRLSEELLHRFDWRRGAAMVEYKVDDASGRPYLMEVNGRFWGSLQLAIDAGVDFPRLLVDAATGRQPSQVHEYRFGVRSRWWWGDVDHLLARLLKSDGDLSLPPGSPGRLAAIWAFFRGFEPGSRNEVFTVADPMPGIRETLNWLRRR